jgi:SpoVK/Ycf46/Vps4 family AAA+-type ATPase
MELNEENTKSEYIPYKFRDLKTYSSTEWLADNRKKYRQVFDRYETGYIYIELSFWNKNFEAEDWNASITLQCFQWNKLKKKEICNLHFKRRVHVTEDLVFVREGWGNKINGSYWRKGHYTWEAYIDNVKIAEKAFYIEDAGELIGETNPYVNLDKIRLYEGSFDDVQEQDRVYLSKLDGSQTRYIYVELTLSNLIKKYPWHGEFIIRFRNSIFELKGEVTRFHNFRRSENKVLICGGWGSNTFGTWREGTYTAEILFMERLLGVIQFEVGVMNELGDPYLSLNLMPGILHLPHELSTGDFDQVMAELNGMIGLQQVKNKIREHALYLQFINLRRDAGFDESEKMPLHCVFMGNPGTGKTTVARMLGHLYYSMGLLSKNTIIEVDRSDLIGEFIGQTAPKVKEVIERARGGVLFIDEAYALARALDDSKDFGREVIEILVKEMASETCDFAVVVAGYPKEMETFVNSNPGLKSRFKSFFEFADYYPEELMAIAESSAKRQTVSFTPSAKEELFQIITNAYRTRTKSFGNARYVDDLVKQAKVNLGIRIMSKEVPQESSKRQLSLIQIEDIQKIKLSHRKGELEMPLDPALLTKALSDLNALVGMEKLKIEIRDLVGIVKYYKQTQRPILNNFFFHTVLVGNPGTGKTTVARILAQIFRALGILERGHLVETDRQGLIAGYVGQTAIKTSEKIDEAMGGVLFIDEAYSLTQSGMTATGDFGAEAIQTILKRMEDDRGKFFVFVAGYPENMQAFLKANPGLTSRFDRTLRFEDYTVEELMLIAQKMIQDKSFKITKEGLEALKLHLKNLYTHRDKHFGNARTVRSLVEDIIKKQNLRLANLGNAELSKKKQNLIEIEDITPITREDKSSLYQRKPIGFS